MTPAEAASAGHGRDHRRHRRDHARAPVGLRPRRLHPRHLGPALPAVRRGRLRLDGDLGDQRADALARALRHHPQAAPRAEEGRDRLRSRAGSTGRATAMSVVAGAIARRAFLGVALLHRRASCSTGWLVPRRADRVPARRGPGRLHRRNPPARRRLGQPHHRRAGRGRGDAARPARRRERRLRHGLSASSTASSSRTPPSRSSPCSPSTSADDARNLRRGRRSRRRCGRAWPSARRRSSPSTCRPSSASAPARASSSCCSTARAARPPTSPPPRGGLVVRGERRPAPVRRLHHLLRRKPAALPRYRPRAALRPRRLDLSDVFAALKRHARLGLRQRLQHVRPVMAGPDVGAAAGPRRGRGHRPHPRPLAIGRDGPRRRLRRAPTTPSARMSIVRYNNLRSVTINGNPAPGVASGTALAAMEETVGRDAAGGLRLSNGPAPRCRRSRRAARRP